MEEADSEVGVCRLHGECDGGMLMRERWVCCGSGGVIASLALTDIVEESISCVHWWNWSAQMQRCPLLHIHTHSIILIHYATLHVCAHSSVKWHFLVYLSSLIVLITHIHQLH